MNKNNKRSFESTDISVDVDHNNNDETRTGTFETALDLKEVNISGDDDSSSTASTHLEIPPVQINYYEEAEESDEGTTLHVKRIKVDVITEHEQTTVEKTDKHFHTCFHQPVKNYDSDSVLENIVLKHEPLRYKKLICCLSQP